MEVAAVRGVPALTAGEAAFLAERDARDAAFLAEEDVAPGVPMPLNSSRIPPTQQVGDRDASQAALMDDGVP